MLHSKLNRHLQSVDSKVVSTQQSMTLLDIEPQRCRPWFYHDRDKAWLRRECCADLIDSIKKNGQIEPVIVRMLEPGAEQEFEIIAGARRWFACSQIPGQKLLVRVIEADDRNCMLLMHAENADSQDISDFERACAFSVQLKSGAFKSQIDLAKALGISQSQLCKMLKTADVFENPWLSKLFESKLEIPVKWAYRLSSLLRKPEFYSKIEAEAARLLEEKTSHGLTLPATLIFKRLIQCVRPASSMLVAKQSFKDDEVLLQKAGKPMILLKKDQQGNLSLSLDSGVMDCDYDQISTLCLKAIRDYCLRGI